MDGTRIVESGYWVNYATVPIGFHTGKYFRSPIFLFVLRFFIFSSNIASLMPELGVRPWKV